MTRRTTKMTTKRFVKIDVVSQAGHDELRLEPQVALMEIQKQTNEQNKWCLIDGKVKTQTDKLTAEDLTKAQTITLTDKMIGG